MYSANKKTGKAPISNKKPVQAVKNNSLQVQDNRNRAIQKKQLQETDKIQQPVAQKKTNNTGLPDQLKSGIENLSGVSMNDVKVKYNSAKPASVQAHAFAQGNQIHVAPGQESHLPHEAWHVVQQKQGRVKPTLQMKGNIKINDDKGLESEADSMGKKAIQAKAIPGKPMQLKSVFATALNNKASGNTGDVMQLSKWRWNKAKHKWELLKGVGNDKPFFPGEYDGEIIDDDEKEEDTTYKGARIIGDSAALARNKYDQSSKKPHVDFKKWRKKKEAQHIIPASTAKKYKSLVNIIDEPENAIMLPSVYKPTNTKLTHRRPKQWNHPTYSKNAERLIKAVLDNTTLKDNQGTMKMIMQALRLVNKLRTHKTKAYSYVDDVPYKRYVELWNITHPTHPI